MPKVSGSIWIAGNDFYFVDTAQRVWKFSGVFVKSITAGRREGSFWVDNSSGFLYYVNQGATAVYRADGPWESSRLGGGPNSLWIAPDDKFRWTDPSKKVYVLHQDVTHVDGGTATHNDTVHTDTPHTNTHSNVAHNDVHTDVPHADSHGDSHGDQTSYTKGTNFGDHVDCYSSTHSDGPWATHLDCYSFPFPNSPDPNPYGAVHSDAYHVDSTTVSGNVPYHDDQSIHWDYAHVDSHTDTHSDVAHSNRAHTNTHTNVAHTDTHGDVPLVNVPHADHNDTVHADTPHTDNPVLTGQ